MKIIGSHGRVCLVDLEQEDGKGFIFDPLEKFRTLNKIWQAFILDAYWTEVTVQPPEIDLDEVINYPIKY